MANILKQTRAHFGAALLFLVLSQPAQAQFDDVPPAGVDPYVLLDYGKILLEDGKVEKAYKWIQAIPLGQAEGYVDEEILIQRMLLSSAFMRSATFLGKEVQRQKLGGPYLTWLGQQRAVYMRDYCKSTEDYLNRTKDGYECGFIRFRLPQVTEAHLQDLELYAATEMLSAAASNWAKDNNTLGRGLLMAQTRAAIVLGAAAHYDLAEASTTLRGVSGRLRAGVPIYPAILLDWLAQTAADNAFGPDELAHLALSLDARLLAIGGGETTSRYCERAGARAKLPVLVAAAKGERASSPQMVAAEPVAPGGEVEPGAAGAVAGVSEADVPNTPAGSTGAPAESEAPSGDSGETKETGAKEDAKEKKPKRPKGRPIPRRPR